MKKILLSFLGLFCLILFSFSTKKTVLAASCQEFFTTIDGSQVTITVKECDTDGRYLVHINNIKDTASNPIAVSEIFVSKGKGTKIFNLSAGTYKAVLFFASKLIKESTEFTVQTTKPLKCGDPCNPNDERCPSECPSIWEGEQWYCKGTDGSTGIPTPPLNSDCILFPMTVGFCPRSHPVTCTDEKTYWWCCKNEQNCRENAPKAPQIIDGGTGPQPFLCKQGKPEEGIQTALGCIPIKDPTQFVGWLLGFAIKIAGGIAFLLIIFGAIKVLTSAGNPENVKAGQEMITSALMGLLFIIFSVFLLELVGVKILNIPGLGTP